MKQIKQVILGFEFIGAKIAAVHLDGGGENVRGVKLFRLGEDPTDAMSWLSEKHCSFVNPADPTRQVAVVLCSTHNGKGGRNQLLGSRPQDEVNSSGKKKHPKDFMCEGCILVGKQHIDATKGTKRKESKKRLSQKKVRILTDGTKCQLL